MIDRALFEENERTAPSDQRRILLVGALQTESGSELRQVEVAYQTWGKLNEDRSNAILVCHALSGDANAAGWWERLIGPGKAVDTNVYYVIGTNALGGCQGSTGPSSLAADGKPYGSRFPMVTVGDMVEVQARLIDALGIDTLLCVMGGSMGGMQALEWSVRFPNRLRKCFVTASSARHSPMQIGFNEVARQAILRDANFRGGDYYEADPPAHGLAVARMLGHISFLSAEAFESKFSRRLQNKANFEFTFAPEFEVESYLRHQGEKFTKRFDANSLLVLTRAIDYYDLKSLEPATAEFLIVSFDSDWLYPTCQSAELLRMAETAGKQARHLDVSLPYGHDAFLLDGQIQGDALKEFLAK